MRLEDMRWFAALAEARSFTRASQKLGIPKQTLSRHIAELESSLDVQLLHRTTRRVALTDAGAAYAARCEEIVRLADEANRAITDAGASPRGVLRITADPVFGEAFLAPVIVEYATQFREVQIDVVLTRRKVDVIEEGFDVAFRVGQIEDTTLTATALGPARVRYCASPAYLARRGRPESPAGLAEHDCIVVAADGSAVRWPFRGRKRPELVAVSGRLRLNSFAIAHEAARAGLGIAIFPEFACADDLAAKRLTSVLDDWTVEVGSVWLVHPAARYLSARVRTFVELAVARLGS